MNNLKAERTLTAFDAWFNEQEGYSLRSERFDGDVEWLRAAFEAGALSTQQSMGEVRVKALEWVQVTSPREDGPPEPIGEYVAETPFGSYYIDMYFGTDSYGWSANFEASDIDGSDSDSPEKAKAAARMGWKAGILHARKRILSALHPNQESGE